MTELQFKILECLYKDGAKTSWRIAQLYFWDHAEHYDISTRDTQVTRMAHRYLARIEKTGIITHAYIQSEFLHVWRLTDKGCRFFEELHDDQRHKPLLAYDVPQRIPTGRADPVPRDPQPPGDGECLWSDGV